MARDIDPDEDRSEELLTGFENENLSEGEEAEADVEEVQTQQRRWGTGRPLEEEGGAAETGT
ncbi:MAG: hypothetical protein ABFD69_07695 [Candidatus Sumerlaeia bacterium]